MLRRLIPLFAAFACAPAAQAGIVAYPSSQTIRPSGSLPAGGTTQVTMNTAIGETEDAQVVVTGAQWIAAAVDGQTLRPLEVRLFFAHYVSFGGTLVPDALLPWKGEARKAEEPNQPLWVQIGVPPSTPAGTYTAKLVLTVDGHATTVPITVRVFPIAIPEFQRLGGNLQATFHASAQLYVNKAAALYGFTTQDERIGANTSLYRFLAEHRISPLSWGFGDPGPKSASGYDRNPKWWLDSATNMEREQQAAGGFPAMRIPISNNRTAAHNYIGGQSPFNPEGWCAYLGSVHDFWQSHGWLDGTMPFLYGLDEPGASGQHLVARQSAAAHKCFGGSRVLLTGNPTGNNRYLWDNKKGDDVDVWTVVSQRYYGSWSSHRGPRREHSKLVWINQAHARGKTIWSYHYNGITGTPGFRATEPLSDARVLILWNALEHVSGVLYGDGTMSYSSADPLQTVASNGDYVLVYPGASEPITSARLEQIRDGIEDWAIYDVVRRRHGLGAVRAILGGNGLFSASASGVKLGCIQFCDLKSGTKFSWPLWSHDASTPGRIESAKLKALQVASG